MQSQQQPKINPLQMQIMQMGFQINDIRQAMKHNNQKQKIIQYLLAGKNNQSKQSLQNNQKMANQDEQNFQNVEQDYKMIFLTRMDIKLPLSKMAVHVANSCLAAFKQIQSKIDYDPLAQIAYFQWTQSGQKKIVLKVNSQQELLGLIEKLKKQKINVYIAKSTKQDQLNIPQGTVTVAAVGPAPQDLLDKLTGHLKLL